MHDRSQASPPRDPATRTVPASRLESLGRRCLEHAGLPADDAALVAEALVDANLRGVDSHGVARLPAYMRRIARGDVGGTGSMREVAGKGPLRRIDAGGALGVAAAAKAADLAADLAAEHGIGFVALGNSSHFGAAGFFARRAAARGLVAAVASNGPAGMAPHGSAKPFLGTDAFAIAIPLPGRTEFVLDASCSVAARGKVIRARELGEPIEAGWAIDAAGRPTRDPAAALAGAVLPIGGAKGSGIALAISLASGLLAGAAFDHEAGRMHDESSAPQNLGQLFAALDPWTLADPAEVGPRLERAIEQLHALTPAPGFDRVRYPGERGEEERRRRLAEGVPVAVAELEAIADVAFELGDRDGAAEARLLAGRPKDVAEPDGR